MQCNDKKATAAVMRCGCWRGVFFEGCEEHCGEVLSTLVNTRESLLSLVPSLLGAYEFAGVSRLKRSEPHDRFRGGINPGVILRRNPSRW